MTNWNTAGGRGKASEDHNPQADIFDIFDIFLKLTADGAVSEGLVHPETPFAVCARAALLKGKFSSPPRAEYWVNIHLELK
jgi:hypothetical protein